MTPIDKTKNNTYLMDIAVLNRYNIQQKHTENLEKYTHLKK